MLLLSLPNKFFFSLLSLLVNLCKASCILTPAVGRFLALTGDRITLQVPERKQEDDEQGLSDVEVAAKWEKFRFGARPVDDVDAPPYKLLQRLLLRTHSFPQTTYIASAFDRLIGGLEKLTSTKPSRLVAAQISVSYRVCCCSEITAGLDSGERSWGFCSPGVSG